MKSAALRRASFIVPIGIASIAPFGFAAAARAAEPAPQAATELQQGLPGASIKIQAGSISRVTGKAMAGGASAEAAADAFRDKAATGLHALPQDLRRADLDSKKLATSKDGEGTGLMYDRATGRYKFYLFRYAQVRGNAPVYGADLRVLVKNEPGYPVVWAGSSLRDLKDFAPAAAAPTIAVDVVKAQAALAAYAVAKGATDELPRTFARVGKPSTLIFAGAEGNHQAPRMAIEYTVEDGDPSVALARIVADATTGEILHVVSLVHPTDVGGTVRAMATAGPRPYDPADADCEAAVSTPMAHAEVSIVGEPVGYTSSTGYYYLTHSGTSAVSVNSPIQGQWFSVADVATTVESLNMTVVPPTTADFLHNADNTSEFIRAQGVAYIHANRVRDFLLGYLPGYPGASTTTDFPITVNYSTLPGGWACPNALGGTGGILFCRQVTGGKNSAFGAVIYHEYGHAIIGYGGGAVSSYHEGMADAISTALDELPGSSYGWANNNCLTPLRWVQNNCQFSATTCTTNCGSGGHACGRLLSGSIWDVRQRLIATHPSEYRDILNPIMFSSIPLNGGSQINSDILDDFLVLDDDNGNLADGTPHRNEICEGFNAHGITDGNCPVPATPCAGVCDSPTVFNWSGSYWSGELGTGTVCRETTQTINGGNCGNLAPGRKLYVNGQEMTCNNQNWSSVPAKVNNGYCMTTTAGDYNWAYFQLW